MTTQELCVKHNFVAPLTSSLKRFLLDTFQTYLNDEYPLSRRLPLTHSLLKLSVSKLVISLNKISKGRRNYIKIYNHNNKFIIMIVSIGTLWLRWQFYFQCHMIIRFLLIHDSNFIVCTDRGRLFFKCHVKEKRKCNFENALAEKSKSWTLNKWFSWRIIWCNEFDNFLSRFEENLFSIISRNPFNMSSWQF